MNLKKSSEMLGKDHYRLLYQTELEKEAEWLRRGSLEKVNSIEILIKRNKIKTESILELGCGTGAVLNECQHRNLAKRYLGVDYSPEAINYLKKNSKGIEAFQYDITNPEFYLDDTIDLAVLSHVLEHLENPPEFLSAMRRSLRFSYSVIEVPLEDLFASRIKFVLRDRTSSKAGHVQFFTVKTFEHLLRSNGFKVVDRRTYVPILDIGTICFVSEKNNKSRAYQLRMIIMYQCLARLLKPFWKRLYYAHHAVLCTADR